MAKILVVDDDPDLVESVTILLEKNKHEVVPAYGGVEGLEKAKKEKPDAIILDIMMPDKNGYEVCKELKGDPGLMQRMVDGEWSDDEFLIVKPGQKITEDLTNEGIIKSE